MLDARSRQLYPLVPSRFLGCQELPRLLLNRSEKIEVCGEVSITNIHFPIEVRVLVVSVLKNMGIICSRALKAAGIDDLPGEGHADKHKEIRQIIMPV